MKCFYCQQSVVEGKSDQRIVTRKAADQTHAAPVGCVPLTSLNHKWKEAR